MTPLHFSHTWIKKTVAHGWMHTPWMPKLLPQTSLPDLNVPSPGKLLKTLAAIFRECSSNSVVAKGNGLWRYGCQLT